MDQDVKEEERRQEPDTQPNADSTTNSRSRTRGKAKNSETNDDPTKRRCVSTACVACRRRKSKCDGNKPCAACSQVYGTQCVYDPNSDHRRKGVYRKDFDNLKTRNSTLQTLIQAILNYPEDDVDDLVRQIRSTESLDKVADTIVAREKGNDVQGSEDEVLPLENMKDDDRYKFEAQLSSKMGKVRLDGSLRYVGGTSNLIYFDGEAEGDGLPGGETFEQHEDPITSWTSVTSDPDLITHLLNHYFTWHYPFFTCMSKSLFYRHFRFGKPAGGRRQIEYCSPLLVNAICALGCHFTSRSGTRDDPNDSGTAGDHFFREARRLIAEDDEFEKPRLSTVQALALMSVREAGCGREARGWQYSGMAFRMACDLGLNYNPPSSAAIKQANVDDEEEDARRITFWGCFIIDKCWSNYLGRMPIFQTSTNITVTEPEVWPGEESETWCSYNDSGFSEGNAQPCRLRAVSRQISSLCDISSDLMTYFYHPSQADKPVSKQLELKRLSEVHQRLEDWRRNLPKELEPKEGVLASVLVMHMFFQLLYIHLFRPFLKYSSKTSPLPAHVSPRKLCTQAATMISKLLRLYKRSFGLRQICNIAVYIAHSACSIHLLNLPDKTASRDIGHGVKHLEEIAEGWPCARRTLTALSIQAKHWNVDLPAEVANVLERTDTKYGRKGSLAQPPEKLLKITGHGPHTSHTSQGEGISFESDNFTASGLQNGIHSTQVPVLTMQEGSPAASSVTSGFGGNPAELTPYGSNQPQDTQAGPPIPSMAFSTSSMMQPLPTTTSGPMNSVIKPHQLASSDMFGGVEALLREGQDWWVKDQSQVASGFGNWGGNAGVISADAFDKTTAAPSHQLQQLLQDKQQRLDFSRTQRDTTPSPPGDYSQSFAPPQSSATIPQQPPNMMNEGRRVSIADQQNTLAGLNGLANYGAIAGQYDESQWYQ